MNILGYKKCIGLEELSRGDEVYATTLVCLGGDEDMKGELYRVEKEVFLSKVSNNSTFMRKLKENAASNMTKHMKSIKTVHHT